MADRHNCGCSDPDCEHKAGVDFAPPPGRPEPTTPARPPEPEGGWVRASIETLDAALHSLIPEPPAVPEAQTATPPFKSVTIETAPEPPAFAPLRHPDSLALSELRRAVREWQEAEDAMDAHAKDPERHPHQLHGSKAPVPEAQTAEERPPACVDCPYEPPDGEPRYGDVALALSELRRAVAAHLEAVDSIGITPREYRARLARLRSLSDSASTTSAGTTE